MSSKLMRVNAFVKLRWQQCSTGSGRERAEGWLLRRLVADAGALFNRLKWQQSRLN